VIEIDISLDSMYNHFHRSVFGIDNYLIAISGISRAIMIGGLFLSRYIGTHMYRSEIIEHLFMGRKTLREVGKASAQTEKDALLSLKTY
jgi:hypothetical protein